MQNIRIIRHVVLTPYSHAKDGAQKLKGSQLEAEVIAMYTEICGSINKRAICLVSILALSFTLLFPSASYATGVKEVRKVGTVDANAEQDFLNKTNALRASKGLAPLKFNSELINKARSWSQTQASAGTIFHSNLPTGVTQNWKRLGENVGMGPSVGPIHDALVRSPRHYENLVDPGFTDVGIGVVQEGNIIYVTQVFMEFMPSSSGKSSTPAKSSNKTSAPAQNVAQQATPVVQAVPLKTASPELNAIVMKISELESDL